MVQFAMRSRKGFLTSSLLKVTQHGSVCHEIQKRFSDVKPSEGDSAWFSLPALSAWLCGGKLEIEGVELLFHLA